ncbi:MAG: hypothetical protein OXG60_00235 [Chloroflexi bacterium]|nr:hypothetical protein [Chloroflexota bacterium]
MLVPKTSEHIAFVCKGDADSYGNSLYTIRPDGGHLRDISVDKSRIHYHLDWSPDGEWLALTLGYRNMAALMDEWNTISPYDEVYRVRYDGTETRRLTYENSYKNTPRWTSDGKDILFHDSLSGSWLLHRVSSRATNTHAVTTFEIAGFDLSFDRQKVAAIALNREFGQKSLYQLNPDGTESEYLMTPDIDVSDIHLSPDKHRILYYSHSGRLHIFNIQASKEESVPPIRVGRARWSPDNRRIAIIGGLDRYRENDDWTIIQGTMADELSSTLFLFDLDTGLLKQVLDLPGLHSSSLSWSPDGQWLAFSHGSPNAQVHKIRGDGSGLQQLTDLDCNAYGVAWSPQ